jgi:hypothetical protein
MRGEFNGLRKKIMDLSPHAYYVHCFAHQLQLVVVLLLVVLVVNPFMTFFSTFN